MDAPTFPSGSPPPPPPAQPPAPPKRGGGKWLLFGCGGCLTLIVLGTLAFAGIFVFAMGVIKKTDVYADALKSAQQSAEVQAALGSPIQTGWLMQGSVNYTNGAGEADINVPLSGPKGQGTMVVKASKAAGGPWQYSVREVRVTGGGTIDLRESP